MKKLFTIVCCIMFTLVSLTSSAQGHGVHGYYDNALGIRAGSPSGITFKHFFSSFEAIEAIASLWPYGFGVTGLYEIHANAFDVEGLNWYYGGGGHLHFYTLESSIERWKSRESAAGVGLGIDGILGIEYNIPSIPFTIGFDFKPAIEVTTYGDIFPSLDPGLSIRFNFGTFTGQ
jgi:hypothetical protein